MTSTPHRLILVDQNLREQGGHYFEYCRSLYEEASRRGAACEILGHRTVDVKVRDALPVRPVFRLSDADQLFTIPKLAFFVDTHLANRSFRQDLSSALEGRDLSDAVLYLHTASPRQMGGLCDWLARTPISKSPRIVLNFHFSYKQMAQPGRRKPMGWHLLRALRRLTALAAGRQIRLGVDSERLLDEYRQYSPLPVDVFPIPHTIPPRVDEAAADGRTDGSLHFVLAGAARMTKGFGLLADTLPLLRDELTAGGFVFHIQSNLQSHAIEPGIHEAIARLEQSALPNVHLIPQSLSSKDYYALLHNSDVSLIPYWRAVYFTQTSGILAEAMAAGKPVIVTEDTWMSDQAKRSGSAITFLDRDPRALAAAIRECGARYAELHANAVSHRESWFAFHNPQRLYEMLMEPAPKEATAR